MANTVVTKGLFAHVALASLQDQLVGYSFSMAPVAGQRQWTAWVSIAEEAIFSIRSVVDVDILLRPFCISISESIRLLFPPENFIINFHPGDLFGNDGYISTDPGTGASISMMFDPIMRSCVLATKFSMFRKGERNGS